MGEDGTPKWSPEQERALQHERFMAEVFRTRKAEESGAKPSWLQFLESAGGVALITVVLGSAGAATLNSLVQQKMKERELAAAAYQEQVKQQQQTINEVSELVAESIRTSEDLIELWTEPFNPKLFLNKVQHERIIAYRNDVRTKFNSADGQWRVESLRIGVSVGLLDNPQGGLSAAWRGVREAVRDYKQCAEDWNYAHQKSAEYVAYEVSRKACGDKKTEITTNLEKFARLAESTWRAASPAK